MVDEIVLRRRGASELRLTCVQTCTKGLCEMAAEQNKKAGDMDYIGTQDSPLKLRF